MEFDLNEVFADMINAVKTNVKEDWPIVRESAATFLESKKLRLGLLAELRLNGEITDKSFNNHLEDEKKILESELHAVVIITKVAAQNAANAAIDILSKAVETALKTL
jgi:hypothetical protein